MEKTERAEKCEEVAEETKSDLDVKLIIAFYAILFDVTFSSFSLDGQDLG